MSYPHDPTDLVPDDPPYDVFHVTVSRVTRLGYDGLELWVRTALGYELALVFPENLIGHLVVGIDAALRNDECPAGGRHNWETLTAWEAGPREPGGTRCAECGASYIPNDIADG